MNRAEIPAALRGLRARWWLRRAGAGAALGAGLAILAAALWRAGDGAPSGAWLVAVCGALTGLLPWVWRERAAARRADLDLLAHLDRRRPELHEAAGLVLATPEALPPLARLQRERALAGLAALPRAGVLPWRRPLAAALGGGLCAVLAVVLARSPRPVSRGVAVAPLVVAATPGSTSEVRAVRVEVAPPAYTARPPHAESTLDVRAEAGARVRWVVTTAGPVERAALLFGDDAVALARGTDGLWTAERTATASELYALRLEAAGREVWRSASARLEVVPDRPPVLDVKAPAPLTEVPFEHPGTLELRGTASDDYGLAGTELLVTVVAGGGEQISVRESRQPLELDRAGAFARTLDLAALGVQKDTELYLRVEAADRRAPVPNRTRSETLRVRAAGPVQLASSGLDAGLRLQPVLEYFRSQRQIILDTEKLMADAPRIARAEFEQRSQALAFDQRALRLRYGALLGEEFESGSAVEAGQEDVEHLSAEAENPEPTLEEITGRQGGDAEIAKQRQGRQREVEKKPEIVDLLPAGMVHQHDSQDEATFFTSAVRTQLKAVLGEMWGAEGALRVFDLKHALPFEYRALAGLKELQQAARVYVPKIGYEAPEIDLARRLKGELDAIRSRDARGPEARPLPQAELRRVLASLEPDAAAAAPADVAVALRLLGQAALDGDGDALRAVDALRALDGAGRALGEAERATLRRALWRALPEPLPAPRVRRVERLGGAG